MIRETPRRLCSDARDGLQRALEISLLVLVSAFAVKPLFDFGAAASVEGLALVSLPKFAGAAFLSLLMIHAWRNTQTYAFDVTYGLLAVFLVLLCLSAFGAALGLKAALTTLRYAAFAAVYLALSALAQKPALRTQVAFALVAASTVTALVAIGSLVSGRTLVAATAAGDPNDLAFLFATSFPLAVWLAWRARVLRWPLAAACAILLAGALLTFSRGILLGMVAGLLWLVLVERRRVRAIAAVMAVVVLLAAGYAAMHSTLLKDSIEAKRKVAVVNVENRLAAWRFAADLVRMHPLLGVGPGNFGVHYERYWQAHPGAHQLDVVHNSGLEIAAEAGIPAFLVFLAFCATVFGRLCALRSVTGDVGAHLLSLRVSMVIGGVAALFVSEQLSASWWILAGLATAAWSQQTHHHVAA